MPNIATKASMLGRRGNSMLSLIARKWLKWITTFVAPLSRMDGYGIDLRGIKIHNDAESPTGVYIPADLEEALKELETILPPNTMRAITTTISESEMKTYHMSLGTWLRDKWGLWTGLRFAQFFSELGIDHPDDMSGIILTSLWRRLHSKPIDLSGQIHRHNK